MFTRFLFLFLFFLFFNVARLLPFHFYTKRWNVCEMRVSREIASKHTCEVSCKVRGKLKSSTVGGAWEPHGSWASGGPFLTLMFVICSSEVRWPFGKTRNLLTRYLQTQRFEVSRGCPLIVFKYVCTLNILQIYIFAQTVAQCVPKRLRFSRDKLWPVTCCKVSFRSGCGSWIGLKRSVCRISRVS